MRFPGSLRAASLAPFLSLLMPLATCFAGASGAGAPQHDWQVYVNERFDYSLCYPADLFVPQGEPDNHDGQIFLAKDGAKLTVFGSNNALFRTLSTEMREQFADLAGKVTYKVVKATWAVESGVKGTNVFYGKILFVHDQFKIFTIVYPAGRGQIYQPIVGKISACFASTA